ncbi:MAG: NUDIX domain-containing protein [Candidatus Aenigmarchaeota archaeon]|nr:NUDIX domain-containing protein [Candidatus Aenigmarchaeota archaeon]
MVNQNKIVKHGLIILRGKKFLINRKAGTKLFLLPGGKPETGETPEECMKREIQEEHRCEVVGGSIKYIGLFEDWAANEPDTIISIWLYLAEIKGEPEPSSEIEEQRWFGREDNPEILSPVLRNQILPELIRKGII